MASILETFYILFKSDADEVGEASKKTQGAVDSLETSIQGADSGAMQMGKSMNNLAAQAVASFASVFAVTKLISGAKGIAEQSQSLGLLGATLGESTAELTNWGRAVQNVGGNADAFEGSLRGLNSSLTDALINGANDATIAMNMLGINILDNEGALKTTLSLLPEIARSFEGLSRVDALAMGQKLGLDEGTILLMRQGEAGVRALVARQRELNSVTDDDRAKLALLNIKWTEFENLLGDIATEVLVMLLPALDMLERGMGEMFAVIGENEAVVMTFLKGLAVVLGGLAIKAAILAIPFVLTAAAIAAVVFIIGTLTEDLMAYVNGQDSMLGKAEGRWKFVADGIQLVKDIIQGVVDLVKDLQERFDALSLPDIVGGAKDKLLGFLDSVDDKYRELTEGDISLGQQALSFVTGTAIPSPAGATAAAAAGAGGNRTSSVSVGTVTVETNATDAAGIAASISGELSTRLREAVDVFDDGVSA